VGVFFGPQLMQNQAFQIFSFDKRCQWDQLGQVALQVFPGMHPSHQIRTVKEGCQRNNLRNFIQMGTLCQLEQAFGAQVRCHGVQRLHSDLFIRRIVQKVFHL
jgi:hypothetical protein